MPDKELFIFGYSGHAYVVLDAAFSQGFNAIGYFDKEAAINNPYKLQYMGWERETRVAEKVDSGYVFPAVGSNKLRAKLVQLLDMESIPQTNIIHSSASVSNFANISESTLCGSKSVVNSMAQIGKGCIINSGAIVEHECILGNYTHIAPGAILAGAVKVGEGSFIGAGAVVKEGITIGSNVIIGAGATVITNVPDNEVWVGNPAKNKM